MTFLFLKLKRPNSKRKRGERHTFSLLLLFRCLPHPSNAVGQYRMRTCMWPLLLETGKGEKGREVQIPDNSNVYEFLMKTSWLLTFDEPWRVSDTLS